MTMSIGWLGTGRMGAAMAGRLLTAGREVTVWNRTRAKAEPLARQGAKVAGSLAGLAGCDLVFTMVSRPADLLEVTTGPGGLLAGPRRPRILVDCSTVDAGASAEARAAAAAAGVAFLAAPVSGNPHVVAAGNSVLMVSGPADVFGQARPYLADIARVVVHVGEQEQSRLVKLCTNLYLGMMVEALVEVTTLAEKGGTSREAFLEVLNATVLSSDWNRNRTPDLLARDWTPTFTTELLRKDFDLGLGSARELEVPMPAASTVYQLIQAAIGHGLRDRDFLSLYEEQVSRAALDTRD
jgi:3-hydroxyisobutyrate dehydrogenase-like beta-hydroxyacid dehydrogenase